VAPSQLHNRPTGTNPMSPGRPSAYGTQGTGGRALSEVPAKWGGRPARPPPPGVTPPRPPRGDPPGLVPPAPSAAWMTLGVTGGPTVVTKVLYSPPLPA
jgi:hypothetical protein